MSGSEIELDGIKLSYGEIDTDRSLVVYLNGYMDTNNSPRTVQFLNKIPVEVKGLKKIIINMKDVSYASSTGIGTLASLLVLCKKHSIELEIHKMGKNILDVVSLLGFTSFFNIKGP